MKAKMQLRMNLFQSDLTRTPSGRRISVIKGDASKAQNSILLFIGPPRPIISPHLHRGGDLKLTPSKSFEFYENNWPFQFQSYAVSCCLFTDGLSQGFQQTNPAEEDPNDWKSNS